MPWELDGTRARYDGEVVIVIARHVEEDQADILRGSRIMWGAGSEPPALPRERVKLSAVDFDPPQPP
ncbi:MAG: hypothetical protein JWM06_1679 [Actinomycetia bacterium]|jgi:hypothetical protein|nr:hypothetical protein [Actinomycetes bacterium]